jgi:farnesyl diphosphate synthase
MMDLIGSDGAVDIASVTQLQRLKTGALIAWSVDAGALLGGADSPERGKLRDYALCLGLAFQIADDLLDLGGDEARVGKRLRKDDARGKATFVTLLGEAEARARAEALAEQAAEHVKGFGRAAGLLQDIARFAVSRDR